MKISLIGDTHIGNAHFREKDFINALQRSEQIIIMGDLIETITKKDKRHSKGDTLLSVDEQIIKSIDILKPFADKIIMYIYGNHENTAVSILDIDPVNIICSALDIDSGITPCIEQGNKKLWVSHGSGAPITYAGAMNQLEKFAKDYVGDIYAIGHTHKLFHIREYRHPKQGYDLINTGTFLDGAEYAEKMKLPPPAIGYYEVNMKTGNIKRIEYK